MEDRELAGIAKRIGVLGEKARRRQESYLNSPIADMPFWDRIIIEYLLEYEARMDEIQAEVREVMDLIKPAPETVEE
jgi:hypothetical protein